jgi:hypothetical protein
MQDVRVVTIPLCEVEYHPRNFDSNNHYAHELPTGRHEAQIDYPEGYRKVMAQTHYSRWKALRKLEHETEFVLTPEDCEMICVAGQSGGRLGYSSLTILSCCSSACVHMCLPTLSAELVRKPCKE